MRVTQIHGPHASRCVAARVATLAPKRSTGFKYIPPPFQPEVPPALDIELPHYNSKDAPPVDVAIAGAGPAGIATAAELGQQGLSVVVVDPAPLQHWPNNYGVWCDEFVAMDLDDCFEHVWPSANVWLGDEDERHANYFSFLSCSCIDVCDVGGQNGGLVQGLRTPFQIKQTLHNSTACAIGCDAKLTCLRIDGCHSLLHGVACSTSRMLAGLLLVRMHE